ncbi:hypothetical protein GWK47_035605 [Chionoecetes opilio]|uniref:Uncharacterized protein n=1 Tax=Chionoecetes opilio TaxID=41210 RepID=A0A8J4YGP9_CHIOP|nr:hypothetical protein GWK47_035605 [Chionoecetes opilio]
MSPTQPAEALIHEHHPRDYPFPMTVADMFRDEGPMYMAYADRLTGWLELAHFPHGTSSLRIKTQLKLYFTRWGAPEQISTEGEQI